MIRTRIKYGCSLVLILVLITSFSACKKDPVSEPPLPTQNENDDTSHNECQPFDSSYYDCLSGGYYELTPAFKYPSINPDNSSEFAYFSENKIFSYNLNSGDKSEIASSVQVVDRLDWGKSGWIIYSNKDWKVYKLSSNSSEIQQLTYNPRDIGPEFNPDGTKLAYARNMEYSNAELQENPELRNKYKIVTIDLSGNPLDSFCRVSNNGACLTWDLCSWSPDGTQFAAPDHGIAIYDLFGNEVSKPFKATDITFISDIEWSPDGSFLFFIGSGGSNKGSIYKLDLLTQEKTLFKEGCQTKFYKEMSISPSNDFFIVQRGIAELEGCDVNISWQIVKLDMEGKNEEIIVLSNE